MPELPDITVYLESLHPRIVGQVLQKVQLASPFLLRTVDPPLAAAADARHPYARDPHVKHRSHSLPGPTKSSGRTLSG